MYAKKYIEKVMNSEPTWQTCLELHAIASSEKLERMMGALSSAIRTGSEVTIEDWGDDWVETALKTVPGFFVCKKLIDDNNFSGFDDWLILNEQVIVSSIHSAYCFHYEAIAQQ